VALDQLQAGLPYTILGFNKQRPITMLNSSCNQSRRASSHGSSTPTWL
jgi:hypothetical protein